MLSTTLLLLGTPLSIQIEHWYIASDLFCIAHAHFIPIVGVGEEGCINWSVVMPKKAAPVTGTTRRTIGPVPADSRQWAPSVRNCVT